MKGSISRFSRYNEGGLVVKASSEWLAAWKRAYPGNRRLQALLYSRGNDLVVTRDEFLEALTADIARFHDEKEVQHGDL